MANDVLESARGTLPFNLLSIASNGNDLGLLGETGVVTHSSHLDWALAWIALVMAQAMLLFG
jgi:hypothetical protein